jgi:hypothetical protein
MEDNEGRIELLAYVRDAVGRLERVTVRDDRGERVVEVWSHDERGQQTQSISFGPVGARRGGGCAWQAEVSDVAYAAPGAVSLTVLRTVEGHPRELSFRGENGEVLSLVVFSYDAQGNLTEEVQTAGSGWPPGTTPEFLSRRVHRYDREGHRIETRTWLFGQDDVETVTKSYNASGDLASEISWEHPGNPSARYFRYTYDAAGNWVERIETLGADEDALIVGVERRQLTYFDGV